MVVSVCTFTDLNEIQALQPIDSFFPFLLLTVDSIILYHTVLVPAGRVFRVPRFALLHCREAECCQRPFVLFCRLATNEVGGVKSEH